jgi:hypothetical protein
MAMSRRTISEFDSEVPERGYQRGRSHEWAGKSPLRLRASNFPPPQSADEADSARFSCLTGWRWTWRNCPAGGGGTKHALSNLDFFAPYIEKETDETTRSTMGKKARHMHTSTVGEWLQSCDTLHGALCNSHKLYDSKEELQTGPRYLIDVSAACLVSAEGKENEKYIALSYVWGTNDTATCTTRSNIEKLQIPGAFHSEILSIPETILDVMRLVEALGKRYVWVDRFCIVQDDTETKQSQLSAMGEVYASAFFTVVAAQTTDATLGLYGRRKMSVYPGAPLQERAEGDSGMVRMTGRLIMREQSVSLMESKYFSRAWTFQEYVFSKRRVVFHGDTVNWECSCSSWHETQDVSVVPSSRPQLSRLGPGQRQSSVQSVPAGFMAAPWPDMHRYARLVVLFNLRDLTYPEDVLGAFAGVLNHLSQTFTGGFISGLPVMCFDAALLWQPWRPLARRESKRASAVGPILPSWSWAGWAGILNSESWCSAANYQFEQDAKEQTSWRTFSTVQWSQSETLTSERRAIRIPSECAQPQFDIIANEVSPPWSRLSSASHTDPTRYFHSSDPYQPFRYPIPMSAMDGSRHPVINARYLHCTTSRAFLKLGRGFKSSASRCSVAEVLTGFRRCAGILRLNCAPSEQETVLENQRRLHQGRCELIEISAGSVKDQQIEERCFDEWNKSGCPRKKGHYDFINVLWIERVDGVAYRKALGRIKKDVWERVAKEKINITLG